MTSNNKPKLSLRFSWKATAIGTVLIFSMLRLSYWQWERHLEKREIIATLEARLELEPVPLELLVDRRDISWDELVHRRVILKGTFDYEHEVILRNRRYKGLAGVYVITPFQLESTGDWILISRGFIPLNTSEREKRVRFRREQQASFTGLIKSGAERKAWAPADPPSGPGHPWVDAWLRVDLEGISRQLPYPLLPLWVEMMDDKSLTEIRESIVKSSEGKEELLSLATRAVVTPPETGNEEFPVPVYDIIIPPGRHLGYVFEWALMALGTLLASIIIQLRRRRNEG